MEKKRLTLLTLVLLIVAAVAAGLVIGWVGGSRKVQTVPVNNPIENTETEENPAPASVVEEAVEAEEEPEEPEEVRDPIIAEEKDVWNILLIGQDKREGEERQRSDSMMILSINSADHVIRVVSIMRDMYVAIPRHKSYRINTAYALGGMELLDETLYENFGVKIDGNVEVDFDTFISAVAEVGDIAMELTAEEAAYLNSIPFAELSDEAQYWHLTEGMNLMNPEQALAYARTRFVGSADFERTERQRKVLLAAFNNIRGRSKVETLNLMNKLLPYVETDLSVEELMQHIIDMKGEEYEIDASYRLPVTGTFTAETVDGMSVIMPDTKANAEYLHGFLYEELPMPVPSQEDAAIEMEIALMQRSDNTAPSPVKLVEYRKSLRGSIDPVIYDHVAAFVAAEDAKWSMLFAWPYFVESIEDPESDCWDMVEKTGEITLKDNIAGNDITVQYSETARTFAKGISDCASVMENASLTVAADLRACGEAMLDAEKDHDAAALRRVYEMLSDLDHYLFNYDSTDKTQLTRTYYETLESLKNLDD